MSRNTQDVLLHDQLRIYLHSLKTFSTVFETTKFSLAFDSEIDNYIMNKKQFNISKFSKLTKLVSNILHKRKIPSYFLYLLKSITQQWIVVIQHMHRITSVVFNDTHQPSKSYAFSLSEVLDSKDYYSNNEELAIYLYNCLTQLM
jgi:hypothetical protein